MLTLRDRLSKIYLVPPLRWSDVRQSIVPFRSIEEVIFPIEAL